MAAAHPSPLDGSGQDALRASNMRDVLGAELTSAHAPKGRRVLLINEIFHSIQGEGTHAGEPMVFVRLTGCPLRCVWCDTAYAFHEGQALSLEEMVTRVKGYGCPQVEVTGGEPLAQKACYELLTVLCDVGLQVFLETAGSHDLAPVDKRVRIIMDLKCPGSGEERRNRWENLACLKAERDEIKFVLAERNDYEWAKAQIATHALASKCCALLLSPVFGKLDYRTLAEWILADRLPPPVRMQLQLHKHIWDPKQRGV